VPTQPPPPAAVAPTAPPPPEFELVLIDKDLAPERITHLLKAAKPELPRYPNGRISLPDLENFRQWLQREDFAPKGRDWWDRLSRRGAYVVGYDSEVRTIRASDMGAKGVDLAYIRRQLQAGKLRKPRTGAPPKKISSSDIEAAVWGDEE
jgi:hypothetical protein